MQSYQKTITVQKDDLDELDHVNNVRYVQWMQDISKEHWMNAASEEMRDGIIWVVMTHHITYKNAAVLNDVIEMRTYIEKSRGAVCTRIVEMHNKKTNELLLKSSTEWCLLNSETYRPTRISKKITEFFTQQ